MTEDEARKLMRFDAPVVKVSRSDATWRGKIVGVVPSPSLILECSDGRHVTIVLDGAKVLDA